MPFRDDLKRKLPLSLGQVMALSNTHYYANEPVFGAAGDFTTAPEISQMFGELLGLKCAEAWLRLGQPSPFTWCELGPGRGTLLKDAIRAVGRVPGFLDAARLHLVETSPRLRPLQQRAVHPLPVTFHDDVVTLPDGQPLLLFANEFFDALPVEQYVASGSKIEKRFLNFLPVSDSLLWWNLPVEEAERAGLHPLADGVWEICEAAQQVMRHLAGLLHRNGGQMVVIDYGYEGPTSGDTVQAVRRHMPVPVLDALGTADITAHVDFAPLRQIAVAAGCAVRLMPQGDYLRELGIDVRLAQLCKANPGQQQGLWEGWHRLTHPTAMGTLFKVMEAVAEPAQIG